MQNGHEYRFRVFADNLHGRSDPSEPSEPIVIKPDERTRSKQKRRLGDGEPRGSYDGPPITDYDRFCELHLIILFNRLNPLQCIVCLISTTLMEAPFMSTCLACFRI